MKRALCIITILVVAAGVTTAYADRELTPQAVIDWSLEAQRAIVPPPAGVGNKFPGEAAVYMGIVHAAIYDAALAFEGDYRPYAIAVEANDDASPAAAVATAAHRVLVGLLPSQREDLESRYSAYLAALPTATPQGMESRSAKRWRRRCSPDARTTAAMRIPNSFSHRPAPASMSPIQHDQCWGCGSP